MSLCCKIAIYQNQKWKNQHLKSIMKKMFCVIKTNAARFPSFNIISMRNMSVQPALCLQNAILSGIERR